MRLKDGYQPITLLHIDREILTPKNKPNPNSIINSNPDKKLKLSVWRDRDGSINRLYMLLVYGSKTKFNSL